jgi:microcystin-dependent protein
MDPFLGEIRMFAGNFAPRGWALCNGQLLPIGQNTALFSLLGTQFGGDGKTNFALPNLQGSTPMHQGNGNGLTPRNMGDTGGSQTMTLLANHVPPHQHAVNCLSGGGNPAAAGPGGNVWAATARGRPAPYSNSGANVAMSPQALAPAGGNQPHNNMSPYLGVSFIIAMQGIYPPRG